MTLMGISSRMGAWISSLGFENRLVSLQSLSSAPSGSKLQLAFSYDWQGRRIQKSVSTWNGTRYVPQSTTTYIYDGWNLIAALNSSGGLQQCFAWGLDLSGSEQGGGGIGCRCRPH